MKVGYLAVLLGIMIAMAQPSFAAEASVNRETGAANSASNTASPLVLQESSGQKIFSGKRGFIHPFLSVRSLYTDNYFNTANNEEGEWLTIFSPGIWVSLPASRQQLLTVNTLNTAPGGLEVGRFQTPSHRRFQGYALYRADVYQNHRFASEDRVNQRAEGLLQVNLRGGLSAELVNIFELSNDPFGTGASSGRQLEKFKSNLFNTLLTYQVGPRLGLRGEYSNYYLNYNSQHNSFRNRDDNLLSIMALYKVSPKTSLLLEYDYIHIDYKENILSGSQEHHVLAGIEYRVTTRTRARIRLGYGLKDFKRAGAGNQNDFIADALIDHSFTPKTSVYLRASRKTNETDVLGTQDEISNRVQIGYRQRLTAKIHGAADLFYTRNDYRGSTTNRKDNYYGARLAFGFAVQRWLNLGVGYVYVKRDSNLNDRDYTNNTGYLDITAAL